VGLLHLLDFKIEGLAEPVEPHLGPPESSLRILKRIVHDNLCLVGVQMAKKLQP
jgi:hypothetical protein